MKPVTGLSLGRIVLGAASVAKPDLAVKALGLDVDANPQLTFMARLFGAREIALGVATIASSGKARPGMVLLGMAVDGADVYAGWVGPTQDGIEKKAGMMMTGVAGGAVFSGLLALLPGRSIEKAEQKAAAKAERKTERKAQKKALKKDAKRVAKDARKQAKKLTTAA